MKSRFIKSISLILSTTFVLFSISCINVFSATHISGGVTGDCSWEIVKSNLGYELYISGSGDMGDYSGNSYPYTSPPYSYSQSGIYFQRIVIEDGVKSIGQESFSSCQFSYIVIPDSVKEIGNSAFLYSTGFSDIIIPDGVTRIGAYAFAGCSTLKSIYLSANVSYVGSYIFGRYYADDNPLDGKDTSHNTSAPIEHIWFGGTENDKPYFQTDHSGVWHYNTCSNHNHTYYDCLDATCQDCEYKRNDLYLFHSYTNSCDVSCNVCGYVRIISHNYGEWQTRTIATCISQGEKYRTCLSCYNEETQTIPALTEHTYKEGICIYCGVADESIGVYTISYDANGGYGAPCTQKTIVNNNTTLAENQPIRDGYLFKGWSTDKSNIVEYNPGDTYSSNRSITLYAVWESSSVVDSGECGEAVFWILYEDGTLAINGNGAMTNWTYSSYGNGKDWNLSNVDIKNVIVKSGVTTIGDYAFYSKSSLQCVVLSDTITNIGRYAFGSCSKLTDVFIYNNLNIESDAFSWSSSLKNLHIPSIESWCHSSFNGLSSNPLAYADNLYVDGELISDIVIPPTVTKINAYLFYNSNCLKTVTLHSKITSIEKYAFHNCSKLSSVYYQGTEESWNSITIENNNSSLTNIIYIKDPTLVVANELKSENKVIFDVMLSSPKSLSGTVLAASYAEGNSMIDVHTYDASSEINISLDYTNGAYVKVMWWDMDTLSPYTKSVRLEF